MLASTTSNIIRPLASFRYKPARTAVNQTLEMNKNTATLPYSASPLHIYSTTTTTTTSSNAAIANNSITDTSSFTTTTWQATSKLCTYLDFSNAASARPHIIAAYSSYITCVSGANYASFTHPLNPLGTTPSSNYIISSSPMARAKFSNARATSSRHCCIGALGSLSVSRSSSSSRVRFWVTSSMLSWSYWKPPSQEA